MPLSPLGEVILTQQNTTVRCTTRVKCLLQEVLSSLYKVGYIIYSLLHCYILSYLYVLCVGLLSPFGPTAVQYNISDTVILRVNITPTATFTRDYLRALTWYHNGVEINPRSYRYYWYYYYYSTISLSTDNTTLNITNARLSDAGVYHVQFAGLRIYPYNKLCEKEILAILRHYPVLSPVVFTLHTNRKWLPSM